MGEIEWAMWANEHALLSALCALLGGVLGVIGQFHHWEFCAATIPISLVVLLVEYPRGKRKKGKTAERRFQVYFAKIINVFGPVTKNYYSRFVVYMIFAIPSCFVISTILGGLGIATAGILYLVAAIKGEEWSPIRLTVEEVVAGNKRESFRPPRRPPPRLTEKTSQVCLTPADNLSRI